ncbi:hypothetical protein [Phyllobacterium sophorae]|uniref:hypothetical protein n=1 Tax=Phyllobacterium sophorae TaxID=1520277 RepID=UPI0011B20624|nr:hypothetical protein [Phyllobacterium sophorae]
MPLRGPFALGFPLCDVTVVDEALDAAALLGTAITLAMVLAHRLYPEGLPSKSPDHLRPEGAKSTHCCLAVANWAAAISQNGHIDDMRKTSRDGILSRD